MTDETPEDDGRVFYRGQEISVEEAARLIDPVARVLPRFATGGVVRGDPRDIRNHPAVQEEIARMREAVLDGVRQRLQVDVDVEQDVRERTYVIRVRGSLRETVQSVTRLPQDLLEDRRVVRPARNPLLMMRPDEFIVRNPPPPIAPRLRPSGPPIQRPATPAEPPRPRGRVLDFGEDE